MVLLAVLAASGCTATGQMSDTPSPQLTDRQVKWCRGNPVPDLGWVDCLAVLGSNEPSRENLAISFAKRGQRSIDKSAAVLGEDAVVDSPAYVTAMKDFNQAIRIDPNLPDGFSARGRAYLITGQFDKAIHDFDLALTIESNSAKNFAFRGYAYRLARQYDRAIQDYDQAIRILPKYVVAFIDRGEIYLFKRQHVRAMQDFDQAIQLDPDDPRAFTGRCRAHALGGEIQLALADCKQSLKLRPDDRVTLNLLRTLSPP